MKEEDELPRMDTRSSHQEKWPSRQNTYDQEVQIEENNKTFTPEITSRQPKQQSPFKWMGEDEKFFYNLFAERENSTKRPTKTNIPAEPITPEQDKTQENQTPFVTAAKEIDSTPTTTQAIKRLEGPQWNTVNTCKRQEGNVQTKNICRTFGNQNWQNSKLHR